MSETTEVFSLAGDFSQAIAQADNWSHRTTKATEDVKKKFVDLNEANRRLTEGYRLESVAVNALYQDTYKLGDVMKTSTQKTKEFWETFSKNAKEASMNRGNTALNSLMPGLDGLPPKIKAVTKENDELAKTQRRNNTLMVQGAAILDDFSNQLQNGGIGPALRAITNNVSFMASQFSGPWAIGVTAAAVGLSVIVPMTWEYVVGSKALAKAQEEAAKAQEKVNELYQQSKEKIMELSFAEEERAGKKKGRERREALAGAKLAESEAISDISFGPSGAIARAKYELSDDKKTVAAMRRMLGKEAGEALTAEDINKIMTLAPDIKQRGKKGEASADELMAVVGIKQGVLQPFLDAKKKREEQESVFKDADKLEAEENKKLTEKRRATKAFSPLDTGMKAQAKGLLGTGMDIGSIKAKMKESIAGHPMADTEVFGEKIDEIVREAQDQATGKEFEAQFAEPMTPQQVALKQAGIQKNFLDIQKRERLLGSREKHGGQVTPGDAKRIDRDMGPQFDRLAIVMEKLTIQIEKQNLEDEMDRRGVAIPANRPVGIDER